MQRDQQSFYVVSLHGALHLLQTTYGKHWPRGRTQQYHTTTPDQTTPTALSTPHPQTQMPMSHAPHARRLRRQSTAPQHAHGRHGCHHPGAPRAACQQALMGCEATHRQHPPPSWLPQQPWLTRGGGQRTCGPKRTHSGEGSWNECLQLHPAAAGTTNSRPWPPTARTASLRSWTPARRSLTRGQNTTPARSRSPTLGTTTRIAPEQRLLQWRTHYCRRARCPGSSTLSWRVARGTTRVPARPPAQTSTSCGGAWT